MNNCARIQRHWCFCYKCRRTETKVNWFTKPSSNTQAFQDLKVKQEGGFKTADLLEKEINKQLGEIETKLSKAEVGVQKYKDIDALLQIQRTEKNDWRFENPIITTTTTTTTTTPTTTQPPQPQPENVHKKIMIILWNYITL